MRVENKNGQIRRRKKKKKSVLGYLFLFAVVFAVTLAGLYYLVASYSPSVDVAIGNNESLTLSDADADVEMKTIDERLKWIQMEDEMPSVAIRETLNEDEKASKKDNEIKENVKSEEIVQDKKIEPPKPAMSDIVKQSADFRTTARKAVIPAPIPSLTKVYIGGYSSIDEAMALQQRVSNDLPEAMPFIKSLNGVYIVQLGSFSNREIADNFILKVREKGYSPKILSEN